MGGGLQPDGARLPGEDEVRTYILTMVAELADMAEHIDDGDLAGQLRAVACPGDALDQFFRR